MRKIKLTYFDKLHTAKVIHLMKSRQLKTNSEGTTLAIKVTPNAKVNQILGWEEDQLKLKIAAIPEKGKANVAIIKYLSQILKIPKNHIRLKQGETNRNKLFFIEGITQKELRDIIKNLLNELA